MEIISFDQLPRAVSELLEKVSRIEDRLNHGNDEKVGDEGPINIKQASEILNLAISTIYGKVCRREIPVSKQGKKLYFLKTELIEWVKSGRKKTTEEINDSVVLPFRRR